MNFETNNNGTRVSLSGDINEDSDFAPLLAVPLSNPTVNMKGVRRVNSCGVREWMGFVKKLNETGQHLILTECPPEIVNQLNLIRGFAGKRGQVTSIYAPYACDKCDVERLILLEVDDKITIDETLTCPVCQEEMEFDDMPDSYLSFRETE